MIDFLLLNSFSCSKEFKEKLRNIAQLSDNYDEITLTISPRYLEDSAVSLDELGNISLCSLSMCSDQTYPEVTILEVAMAVENGADEIEIPLDIVAIADDKLDLALGEIEMVCDEISGAALLSVVAPSSNFDTFDSYSKIISKLLDMGVDNIVINNQPEALSSVKFLKESVEFLTANYPANAVKVFVNSKAEDLNEFAQNGVIFRVEI